MGLTTTLLDSSAWVEFLRGTGSHVNVRVREMLRADEPIGTTDVVILELLSGATTPTTKGQIWGLLNRCIMLPVRPLFEYEMAADLYRLCRAAGFTPANTNDLLIASVAIGKDVPLLAHDSDFEKIADVSNLRLAA